VGHACTLTHNLHFANYFYFLFAQSELFGIELRLVIQATPVPRIERGRPEGRGFEPRAIPLCDTGLVIWSWKGF